MLRKTTSFFAVAYKCKLINKVEVMANNTYYV